METAVFLVRWVKFVTSFALAGGAHFALYALPAARAKLVTYCTQRTRTTAVSTVYFTVKVKVPSMRWPSSAAAACQVSL